MKDHPSNFGLPEDYDIEENSDSENVESSDVVKAGEVQTWKTKRVMTVLEKRMSLVLLMLCLFLWPIYAMTTLVMAVLTSNPAWITAFGATFTPLILILLRRYFR